MEKFVANTNGKTAELNRFVVNLIADTNKKLAPEGAELKGTLTIRDPFTVKNENFYNGYVNGYLKLTGSTQIEPYFANENDRRWWESNVLKTARERFGIWFGVRDKDGVWQNVKEADGKGVYWGITFEEDSEKEHYALTPKKERIIKKGLENLVEFMKWYNHLVKAYDKAVISYEREVDDYFGRRGAQSIADELRA